MNKDYKAFTVMTDTNPWAIFKVWFLNVQSCSPGNYRNGRRGSQSCGTQNVVFRFSILFEIACAACQWSGGVRIGKQPGSQGL